MYELYLQRITNSEFQYRRYWINRADDRPHPCSRCYREAWAYFQELDDNNMVSDPLYLCDQCLDVQDSLEKAKRAVAAKRNGSLSNWHIIKPYLCFEESDEPELPAWTVLELAGQLKWVTVHSMERLTEVLRLAGLGEDELKFTISYGIHGAPEGTDFFKDRQ